MCYVCDYSNMPYFTLLIYGETTFEFLVDQKNTVCYVGVKSIQFSTGYTVFRFFNHLCKKEICYIISVCIQKSLRG